ncbi:hypothetical protein WR25_14245 [Diploscapter pachys]|uniref:Cytochrome c domain-containing protein n=1 Tax=Diploscapter pachys TaxID=2018661 RepID=A0A2A2KGR4_9BILA|nr:hypothetical protein WR25_14245 [Diploscapter pachys]
MRRAISITVLSALAGLAQAEGSTPFDCNQFMQFGGNVDQARQTFAQGPESMSWNWFVCLNQPVESNSPNRVWETLKPSDQVYLSNGAAPLPWGQSEPVPAAVLQAAQAQGLNPDRTFHNLNAVQQVDGLILEMGGAVPTAQQGQPVRFQLLMGEDTFDYIVQKQVYNVNGQAALTSNLAFPSTAWELKAAWLNSTGPTPAAQTANTTFQAMYPALAQYELIGTQSETNPKLLANSQLESAFQSQSSCFACHGTAAYSKTKGYFNFAQKQQGGIVYPTAEVPASEFAGYNKLDFVWSLKRAQWQR